MKKISILLLVIVAVLASCKKTPEVNLKYVDVERDLITVGTTTATVQCDYDYITTLKKAFLYYGEGEDEADMGTAEMRVVQHTLYVDLVGLRENTTYSYYYEFVNGFNSMRTVCKTFKTGKSPTTVNLPTVVTAAVTEITASSAKCGGEVTVDGGAEVTERGICWGTNENPTLNNSHVSEGTGTGAFIAMMEGLEANTTYHVRAYATNEAGTAYGLDREFVTTGSGSGVPEGAIDGLFSVSPTQKVYFSQGNLQYQASTNTWRFAEQQWDYVGNVEIGTVYENGVKCDNELASATYGGWIDLFGWGTSGYNHGAVCYQPWSTSTNSEDYYAYGDNTNNLSDQTGIADWGYNAISNGGNCINQWRVLNEDEWQYLLFHRSTELDMRFVKAQVNEIKGIIVFPDNWTDTDFNNINEWGDLSFSTNTISITKWSELEFKGAAFLPCAHSRTGAQFYSGYSTWSAGNYWSSTVGTNGDPMFWNFSNVNNWGFGTYGYYGFSVRLVQDANKTNKK